MLSNIHHCSQIYNGADIGCCLMSLCTSGLGVPGRRYSLGEFIGAFRFLRRSFRLKSVNNVFDGLTFGNRRQAVDGSYQPVLKAAR